MVRWKHEACRKLPLKDLIRLCRMTCQLPCKSYRCLVKRPNLCLVHWEKTAWGSLGVILAAGISAGVVTWLQLSEILRSYGASGRLPSLLAATVVLQTGPILTSLIAAARLGAGYAAELATMNLTEETEVLDSLGVDLVESLVAPRVIAATLALPTLTLILNLTAIASAMMAEICFGESNFAGFFDRTLDLLTLQKVLPATLKTSLFGFLISVTSCHIGISAPRETEAVGKAAVRGVVTSIFLVMAADVFFEMSIQQFTALLFGNH